MSQQISALFSDIDVAAKTVYGEARGETYAGKLAVAWVIRTRAEKARQFLVKSPKLQKHGLFGDGSLASVCRVPWQFSCWNLSDPNYRLINQGTMETLWRQPAFNECLLAVLAVQSGREPDNTSGATHYFDPRSANPDWAKGLTAICTIGNHRFYNNVP